MKSRFFVLIIVCLCISTLSAQTVLYEKDVKDSVMRYFPSVLSATEAIEQRRFEQQSAAGQFDTKIKYENASRTEGYYTGQYGKASIEKPLYFANAKVYGHYRQSSGTFPTYEDQFNTRSRGETGLGISLSVLRDSWIDAKRTTLTNAELDLVNQYQQQRFVVQSVLQKASKEYWTWIYAYQLKMEYVGLYELAKKRQEIIKARVKKGDLPDIYLTENLQYLLQRQNQLMEADRDLEIQKRMLALYVRDPQGLVTSCNHYIIPDTQDYALRYPIQPTQDIVQLLAIHPFLFDLDTQIKQIQNEITLYENQNLPAVDLSYEYSSDSGKGSGALQDEGKVKLSISTPIERREKGSKRDALDSKKRQLLLKKFLIIDQFKQDLAIVHERILTAEKTVKNSNLEIEVAQKMVVAEQKKFLHGDSDMFVLNIREQNLTKAKIDNLKYTLELKKAHIEYDALMMRL